MNIAHGRISETDLNHLRTLLQDGTEHSVAQKPIRVLLAASAYSDQRALIKELESDTEPEFLVAATDLNSATAYITRYAPNAILLDANLTDPDELAQFRRIMQVALGTPVIVLTDSSEMGPFAMREGAQDCLDKGPINTAVIKRSIAYGIERLRSEEARMRSTALQDIYRKLAHDLKVPLSGSKLVLSAISEQKLGNLNQAQREALSVVIETVDDVERMMSRLIEIYRYEATNEVLQLEPVDVINAIETCMSLLQPITTAHQASIRFPHADERIFAYVDKIAVHQLLMNLMSNAVRFTTPRIPVEIRVEGSSHFVAVHIKNYGVTIKAEQLEVLFSRFWQGPPGKAYSSSIGVGLYLSKRIITMHGGNIWCTSNAEEGTTFSVELPVKLD